jgi:hypothetical protein
MLLIFCYQHTKSLVTGARELSMVRDTAAARSAKYAPPSGFFRRASSTKVCPLRFYPLLRVFESGWNEKENQDQWIIAGANLRTIRRGIQNQN